MAIWTYVFQGRAKHVFVATLFGLVGVLLLLMPMWIFPQPTSDMRPVAARVVEIEASPDGDRPIFVYQDEQGQEQRIMRNVWSKPVPFAVGQTVILRLNPADPASFAIEHDPEAAFTVWTMRLLAVPFLLIALVIAIMVLRQMPDYLIDSVGGLLGALSFAIPALFTFPIFIYLYHHRPNFLYPGDAPFGTDQWIVGSVFSVLGLIVLIASIAMFRYQLKHQKVGWSKTWTN